MSDEPNVLEVFREAIDVLTRPGPPEDGIRVAQLFSTLSAEQLKFLSGVLSVLVWGIDLQRKEKIKEQAGRN